MQNFVLKKYIKNQKNKRLLDIGCGDGRDTIYFSKKIDSTGIDKSNAAIKFLQNKYSTKKRISFLRINLNNLNFSKLKEYDYVYMRFLFHAINSVSENNLLNNLRRSKKKLYFYGRIQIR